MRKEHGVIVMTVAKDRVDECASAWSRRLRVCDEQSWNVHLGAIYPLIGDRLTNHMNYFKSNQIRFSYSLKERLAVLMFEFKAPIQFAGLQ